MSTKKRITDYLWESLSHESNEMSRLFLLEYFDKGRDDCTIGVCLIKPRVILPEKDSNENLSSRYKPIQHR